MDIELKSGESVRIKFAETDGEIEVSFGETSLTVNADLPDSHGRQGCIYEENFGDSDEILKYDMFSPVDQTLLNRLKNELRHIVGKTKFSGNPAAVCLMAEKAFKFLLGIEHFAYEEASYSINESASTLSNRNQESQLLTLTVYFESDEAPVAKFVLGFEVHNEGEDEDPSYSFTVESHLDDNDESFTESFSCEFGHKESCNLMLRKLSKVVKAMMK